MSQVSTTPQVTVVQVPAVERTIALTPKILANHLKELGSASSFIGFSADYDLDTMMNKGRASNRNPHYGKGYRKASTTQASVNWASSQKKTEDRGGVFSGKGSWHTVVMIDGKVTPLSVHKADVLCEDVPTDDGKTKKVAIVSDNGNLTYTAESPRFYLRYEVKRDGGDGARSERRMRSTSEYRKADGTVVDKATIEPWLKSRGPRKDETDIQLTALGNLTALQIDGDKITVI
tara:strand:+ start:390 stop:1088 length:699 start_codon:yes stop_codon:yes gene_type:complete